MPPVFLLSDFFYFLEAVPSAAVYTGAFLNCLVPGAGAGQIAQPERPYSALVRPNIVYLATAIGKEYAVFGQRMFNN